jgi:uncharacterized OB-fold protein
MPGFDYPLPVILVELDEGLRIVANLIDAAESEIAIGQSVTCEFRVVEPGYTLPVFRRS